MASESVGKEESNRVSNKKLMEVIQNYCQHRFLDLNRSRIQNRCFSFHAIFAFPVPYKND